MRERERERKKENSHILFQFLSKETYWSLTGGVKIIVFLFLLIKDFSMNVSRQSMISNR